MALVFLGEIVQLELTCTLTQANLLELDITHSGLSSLCKSHASKLHTNSPISNKHF